MRFGLHHGLISIIKGEKSGFKYVIRELRVLHYDKSFVKGEFMNKPFIYGFFSAKNPFLKQKHVISP